MEKVSIWFLTDNSHGEKLVNSINSIGLTVTLVRENNFFSANIIEEDINVFIIDLEEKKPAKIIKEISKETRLHGCLKFILLPKKEIKDTLKISINMMHLEYISKPVEKREFLLLIEKSVLVERYRKMMRDISEEAELRIEAYEGLMDIGRKDIFESDREKEAFKKILNYEKGLMNEQLKLNHAIKDFTMLRQNEMFHMKSRIKADEMLSTLAQKELLDANETIHAHEAVLDYSSTELEETKKIYTASENTIELSRMEAIELHEKLDREREINKSLSNEIEQLLEEIERLKKDRDSK